MRVIGNRLELEHRYVKIFSSKDCEWVAKILGLDDKYGFKREFLTPIERRWSPDDKPQLTIFEIEEGYYEVNDPHFFKDSSEKRSPRSFIKIFKYAGDYRWKFIRREDLIKELEEKEMKKKNNEEFQDYNSQ